MSNEATVPSAEELSAMLTEAVKLRDEIKRYRDEARTLLANTRTAAALAHLPEVSRDWITDCIPTLPGSSARSDAGERAYLLCREHASRADYNAYIASLTAAGFTLHVEREAGRLICSTWHSPAAVLSVSFADTDGILRTVVEPADETALPPLTTVSYGPADAASPLLVQESRLYRQVDCGMSYIFRLRDGSFFLIDGGWNTPGIADDLYETLLRLSDGRRPEIAAWIFTHAHVDHIGAFFDFAEKYADRVTLHSVIYNFPGKTRLIEMGDTFVEPFVYTFRDTVRRFGEKTVIYKARTGQRFSFTGFDVDILFTYEDYRMPHPLRNFNETSLVFRITTEGQRLMFLGDVFPTGCEILCARYGELLRSDAVQVAHHGYWGGTKEIYDAIAAPVVLWPCPYDAPNGHARYSDPEWSPITREMVRTYARRVWCTADGNAELALPLEVE